MRHRGIVVRAPVLLSHTVPVTRAWVTQHTRKSGTTGRSPENETEQLRRTIARREADQVAMLRKLKAQGVKCKAIIT